MALVVDCHMHLIEPDWNPQDITRGMSQSWARQVRWFDPPKSDPAYLERAQNAAWDGTGAQAVARMDDAGVDVSVMMPMDHGLLLGEEGVIPIAEKNRLCAEAARNHPGRLYTFCGVDPRRPDALAILTRAVDEWGAIGLKLYPPNGFYPSDEVVYPLYRFCVERDIPVLLHQGHSAGHQKSKFAHPVHVDTAAADFPDLKLVMGHSGRLETWSHEALSVAIYKTNVHLDLSLWQHWISPDELVRKIVWMRDRIGPDRILFGSDMAGIEVSLTLRQWVHEFRMLPEWAKQLGYRIPGAEIDLILGENTRRVYKIPSPPVPGRKSEP
jgi:predicted TIM-barrel fold metal-dependent hydrolase